jgi:hypothetical protein
MMEGVTAGLQIVVAVILGFTVRLMFLNDRNARKTMGIITETMQVQAGTFNQMILRLHQVERRLKELEDARASSHQ